MAKLYSLKRIVAEDFPEQQGWIGKLLSPLNSLITSLAAAMNKGLDNSNFAATSKEMKVSVNANTYPFTFKWPLNTKPTDLWITYAKEDAATPTTITSAVWADWSYVNGNIQINNISGLTSGKRYVVRFWVFSNQSE